MSPKKKITRKGTATQRRGISGNPRRRAEQLGQERPATSWGLGNPVDQPVRLMLSDPDPGPWWPASHQRILRAAQDAPAPSGPMEAEAVACQVVGDEFWDRMQSPDGAPQATPWLCSLVETAGAELRSALIADADGWPGLWTFLYGVALTAPRGTPSNAARTHPTHVSPAEMATTVLDTVAALASEHELETPTGHPVTGARPAGAPLIARDAYGSRALLMAPFEYEGAFRHWYAWDIDMCWIDVIVSAGAFSSAEDALGEWRDAVGLPAKAAELSSASPQTIASFLAPLLRDVPFAELLEGHEHRDLIREFYRLRRRAHELVESLDYDAASEVTPPLNIHETITAFRSWYAVRHDTKPEPEDVGTIIEEWGHTGSMQEAEFYASSPHRIQMAAHLINDGYLPKYAAVALRMLPDWVDWCIEHTDLDTTLAERSRRAAHNAAANPDGAPDSPFRRRE